MKLSEITEDKNETKIMLTRYFTINGNHQINDNNSVNVDGDVWYNGVGNIPIKFDKVLGHFDCKSSLLTTLVGSPTYVGGQFICWGNDISSLDGGPKFVGNRYSCNGNPITSLDGLPLEMKNGWILLDYNSTLPLLKLLFIKNLVNVVLDPKTSKSKILASIINKYIGTGRKGALQCAAELSAAGFKNNARM